MKRRYYWVICVLAALLVYGIEWSPAARRCKDHGGSYFLNGDCVAFAIIPVDVSKN